MGGGDAGGREVCSTTTVTREASTLRGSGVVTGPWVLAVSWVKMVRLVVVEECTAGGSPPGAAAIRLFRQGFWRPSRGGRHRDEQMGAAQVDAQHLPVDHGPCAPRTQTHAESLAVSVSACAEVDPAGQSALAVYGIAWS